MSEEEILEIMKNLLLMPTDWIIKSNYKGNLEHIGALQGNEAIEGLLDLYNKDKERNTELRIQISARETVVDELEKENKELKKQLNDIHSNFCKFNWKESNNRQVYNQLKELYESIYRKGNK